jgi:hypothetical protein
MKKIAKTTKAPPRTLAPPHLTGVLGGQNGSMVVVHYNVGATDRTGSNGTG